LHAERGRAHVSLAPSQGTVFKPCPLGKKAQKCQGNHRDGRPMLYNPARKTREKRSSARSRKGIGNFCPTQCSEVLKIQIKPRAQHQPICKNLMGTKAGGQCVGGGEGVRPWLWGRRPFAGGGRGPAFYKLLYGRTINPIARLQGCNPKEFFVWVRIRSCLCPGVVHLCRQVNHFLTLVGRGHTVAFKTYR